MKLLKKLTIILTSFTLNSILNAQAPNVEIKMCGPTGSPKIVGAFTITLKCDLCCQGVEPNTYVPIKKCMPDKTTICGTDFLTNPANSYSYGYCLPCVTIETLDGTAENPIRYKVTAHAIGRWWIVSGYSNYDDNYHNGIVFNLVDILEGGESGNPI